LNADYGEIADKIAEKLGRLNSLQSDRSKVEELERRMCDMNTALAGAEGRLDNLKIEVAGELKLVHEMLGDLNEKLQSIDRNTSKAENTRRTWRIALMAAIPGVISIMLRIVEMINGG
jgi:DNA repair exonuclease SbcCD ATPase subunit